MLRTLHDALLAPTVLAFHQGQGGAPTSVPLLLGVIGLIATAVWLLFSTLKWRNTVLTAAGVWATGLVVLFAI
jgi:hypothetical protein